MGSRRPYWRPATRRHQVYSYGQTPVVCYDIADLYKFNTAVPIAFSVAGKPTQQPEREGRHRCRDAFRQSKLLERIIPDIETLLAHGGLTAPQAPEESVAPAIPNAEGIGDAGHRP
jgi:CRISPR-associated protein Cas1